MKLSKNILRSLKILDPEDILGPHNNFQSRGASGCEGMKIIVYHKLVPMGNTNIPYEHFDSNSGLSQNLSLDIVDCTFRKCPGSSHDQAPSQRSCVPEIFETKIL
ncbi:hypothetical protein NPIL_275271 [Nephila pilipes]|uniref:Uncharacterized protein n=1 Tax=Nephila pilipes TaxID=299642 RepID=A0A8X6USY6_NEPPI|nr:hypothetical protein NPIL_275271 [Nephila pilipes]